MFSKVEVAILGEELAISTRDRSAGEGREPLVIKFDIL
jgi:hypothetical protein